MTLCIAWIRQNGDEKELVMATDSRLTGGESWDSGVKLFELPRQDCLLCFAGGTARAYPLILNTISAIKFDHQLTNQHTDIHDVLEYLVELFTRLVGEIQDVAGELDDVRAEAEFLFGGWSWKAQEFGIWRLYYNRELEAFTHESINQDDARVFTFLGNDGDSEETQRLVDTAQQLLEERLRDADKLLAGLLDMEPLQVLTEIARDPNNFRSVGGAIQLAKVYQSGASEFFGVMWPASSGQPTFLGRELSPHDMPPVRIFDPDTALLLEDLLPDTLTQIDPELYEDELDFVIDCYPDGHLDSNLSPTKQRRLKQVIQSAAYRKYCAEQNTVQEPENA